MFAQLIVLANQLDSDGFTIEAENVGRALAASYQEQEVFDHFIVEAKGGWKQKVLPWMLGLGLAGGGVATMMDQTPGQEAPNTQQTETNVNTSWNVELPAELSRAASKLGAHLAKFTQRRSVGGGHQDISIAQMKVRNAFAGVYAGKLDPVQALDMLVRNYDVDDETLRVVLEVLQCVEQMSRSR